MDVKELIGRNLRVAREAAELSQEAFAERLAYLGDPSGFENGKVAIDSAQLLKAAQILGTAVADFFKQDDQQLALLIVLRRTPFRIVQFVLASGTTARHIEIWRKSSAWPTASFSPGVQVSTNVSLQALSLGATAQSERERLGLGQLDPIPCV